MVNAATPRYGAVVRSAVQPTLRSSKARKAPLLSPTPSCSTRRPGTRPSPSAPPASHRFFSSASPPLALAGPSRPRPPPRPSPSPVDRDDTRHRHQFNPDPFTLTPPEEHKHLPLVNAQTLAASKTRPRSCRMLARDFIHDSLYNPHYGYFSRHAVLLPDVEHEQGEREASFGDIKNEADYMRKVEGSYIAFEKTFMEKAAKQAPAPPPPPPPTSAQSTPAPSQASRAPSQLPRSFSAAGLDAAKAQGRAAWLKSQQQGIQHDEDVTSMVARQVWHTPTQLFKPHYANIVAQHCVDSIDDGRPLIIYEMGAGSGAMAECVLNYVQERYPEVYSSMQYHIIEISDRLATQQTQRLTKHLDNRRVTVHRQDILTWDTPVQEDCFVLGLEVLDNLSHDVVRYSTSDSTPYQCYISIDSTGDMHELYTPVTDPLIRQYLSLYHQLRPQEQAPALPKTLTSLPSPLRRLVANQLPFYPNMSQAHFIPTSSLKLLQTLARFFPNHRPIFSDFHTLPKNASVKGINGPIVQTRIGGEMVDVGTYAVLQGYFDIFFPTDFELLRDFYAQVATDPKDHGRGLEVVKHRAFLERYPHLAQGCQLKDGTNPMLSWYENASWLVG